MANLKNITINDTGYLKLPVGPTGTRPGGAVDVFTTVGQSSWTAPAGVTSVEVLVVGGGGGGGNDHGGGGGAGGVVYNSNFAVTPGTSYTVVVGQGGPGANPLRDQTARGVSGSNSVFHTITAIGGGGGGGSSFDPSSNGLNGGSGGGSSGYGSPRTPGAGTAGQGYAGGTGANNAPDYQGAGGGGSAQAGTNGTNPGGNAKGGDGLSDASLGGILAAAGAGVVVSGVRYIAGGGGGCSAFEQNGNFGAGGLGGGGRGATNTSSNLGIIETVSRPAENGMPNTGSGGGGANRYATAGLHAATSIDKAGDGGSGIVIIRYTTPQSSVTPSNGMIRYNSSARGVEFYSQGAWRVMPLPFIARQVITTAYTMGGYKDSVAWNNVNKTISATDTTTNLGDGSIERSFNYQSGACSRDIGYVFGAANAAGAASNYIIAYNMRTETQVTSGFSRTLANNNFNTGTVFKETDIAWNSGGGNALIEEFNLITQTVYSLGQNLQWSDATWAMSHENYGIFYGTEKGANFHFATRTSVSRSGTQVSAHHQQKSIQSKLIYAYAGNEGTYNGGNSLRRTNMITNTVAVGVVAKPVTNSGEENLTLGQNHQYMIGCYDGLQNNRAWRFTYSNETGFEGGSTLQPKGKAGVSSAFCVWRD